MRIFSSYSQQERKKWKNACSKMLNYSLKWLAEKYVLLSDKKKKAATTQTINSKQCQSG